MMTMTGIRKLALGALLACIAGWQFFAATAVQAGPVEYVQICPQYASGYFYIPGTSVCQDANQILANQNALSSFSATAYQGVAISTAIVAPFMPSNANYAVSVHWGGFEGSNAFGLGGLMRVGNSNFFLSGGLGTGFEGGPAAERAGFMFAW
jgi:hypothetical protein